jgi:uncharacterized protein (TIGR00251 family)
MRISVRVIPRSRKNQVEWEDSTSTLKVRLTAPPVDGAANDALVAFLADTFGLPKSAITIVRGATSRQKIVEMMGITREDVERRQ